MLLDLPSRQDFETLQSKLDAVLGLLKAAPSAVDFELMSVEEVASFTRFDRRTVEKWVSEGHFNDAGKRIYLPTHKYSGRLRFKRADVEAFGLGVGVLTSSLTGEAEPVKKTKKSGSVSSDKALRKVA